MKRPTNRLLNWVAAAVVVGFVAACGGQPPVQVDRTLSVSIDGTGTGTVISVPAGIDLASGDATATADFAAGTEVELTATATAGSTFAGWAGGCTGTATCTVTLDSGTSVTATFTAPVVTGTFDLTLNAAGSGAGAVTSDLVGFELAVGETLDTAVVDAGTVVTMTATAEPGSVFAGWTGDCTGKVSCMVTVNAATAVTASFVLAADATAATFNILAASDDAEEYLDAVNDLNPDFPAGSVDIGSSDLDLAFDISDVATTTTDRGNVAIGLRYGNVSIPQGAVITSATVTFTRLSSSGSTVTFLIEGQAADDAGTFVYDAINPANFDITGRTPTTANVAWAPVSLVSAQVVTDDVATIVQEIVDRAGWASGNALAFRITSPNSSASNVLRVDTFDDGGLAAFLSVSYVTPVAP